MLCVTIFFLCLMTFEVRSKCAQVTKTKQHNNVEGVSDSEALNNNASPSTHGSLKHVSIEEKISENIPNNKTNDTEYNLDVGNEGFSKTSHAQKDTNANSAETSYRDFVSSSTGNTLQDDQTSADRSVESRASLEDAETLSEGKEISEETVKNDETNAIYQSHIKTETLTSSNEKAENINTVLSVAGSMSNGNGNRRGSDDNSYEANDDSSYKTKNNSKPSQAESQKESLDSRDSKNTEETKNYANKSDYRNAGRRDFSVEDNTGMSGRDKDYENVIDENDFDDSKNSITSKGKEGDKNYSSEDSIDDADSEYLKDENGENNSIFSRNDIVTSYANGDIKTTSNKNQDSNEDDNDTRSRVHHNEESTSQDYDPHISNDKDIDSLPEYENEISGRNDNESGKSTDNDSSISVSQSDRQVTINSTTFVSTQNDGNDSEDVDFKGKSNSYDPEGELENETVVNGSENADIATSDLPEETHISNTGNVKELDIDTTGNETMYKMIVIKPAIKGLQMCKERLQPCCVDGQLEINLSTFGRPGLIRGQLNGVVVYKVHNGKEHCGASTEIEVDFEGIGTCSSFGCVSAPYCGRRLLKIELNLSTNRRTRTMFEVLDAESNGDSARVLGFYPDVSIFTRRDRNGKGTHINIQNAFDPYTSLLTLYIGNQFVRLVNENGHDESVCNPGLFQLNGQSNQSGEGLSRTPDSEAGNRSGGKVWIGINRSVHSASDEGVGICSATLSWACPWSVV